MIVRIADKMGADVRKLVPFGKGLRADMGQTRGAQSGEADRHAVWLTANNLEPKPQPVRSASPSSTRFSVWSPATTTCCGCNCSRGNDQHICARRTPGLVQITASPQTWCCPPTTRSLPPARWAATPPCCHDLQRTEARPHSQPTDLACRRLRTEARIR